MAARVTHHATDALVQPTAQRARVSHVVVDALFPSELAPAPGGAATKRWDGSAWQTATAKRWDGSGWVTATVKRWDGGAWV